MCAHVATCVGTAFDKAVTAGDAAIRVTSQGCGALATAANNFLTLDNYSASRQALAGALINFAINVISNVPNYYMNLRLSAQVTGGKGTNNVCGQSNTVTYASNASTAMYEFCLAIQNELKGSGNYNTITSNYSSMDSTSAANPQPDGKEGLAKFFISGQAGVWGPVCNDWGINWKL